MATRQLRLLMALLTVLAANLFPFRLDGLGSIKPASTISGPEVLRRALSDPDTCGRTPGHSGPHHHLALPSAGHPSGTGRTPEPANHAGHSAHCPFCLTNAFGLEGAVVGLALGPPDYLPSPEPVCLPPLLAIIRHADARAPPIL